MQIDFLFLGLNVHTEYFENYFFLIFIGLTIWFGFFSIFFLSGFFLYDMRSNVKKINLRSYMQLK